MYYVKQTWVDGETPIDAEHLNHMEDGIAGAARKDGWAGNKYLGTDSNGNIITKDAPAASTVPSTPSTPSTTPPTSTTETTVEESGALVTLSDIGGKALTVKSTLSSATSAWMVHTGRNFVPTMPTANAQQCTEVDGGFTCANNTGGTVFPTTSYVWLPAGTYNFSFFGGLTSGRGTDVVAYLQTNNDDYDHCIHEGTPNGETVTFATPTQVRICYTFSDGITETVKPVLVRGSTKADFAESYKGTTYTATFDTATTGTHNWSTDNDITAFDGVNNIYDSSGNVTVSYKTVTAVSGGTTTVSAFNYAAYGLPVLALSGDISTMTKETAVTLDYTFGEQSGTLTCKWQGSSSLAYPKKNYTLKFDNAFAAKDGWGSHKKYVAKANYIDFSHSRNIVSARLWGQMVACRTTSNTKLAGCPNYGAIDGFPICITINGVYYGVYTLNVPKDDWMMGMGDGTNECILCAGNTCEANLFKAAATLDGESDLEIEYITDESNTAWAVTSVNNLITACINSNGNDLDTTIAGMLDWESAIDYYILVAMVRGDDMVGKNYLLNTYDGTKWFFGAYDMDSTYGLQWDGKKFLTATKDTLFTAIAENHRLFELILTHKKTELKQRYNALRSTVLSEDNVATEFRNFAGSIPRPLLDEDNRCWPGIPQTSCNNVQQIIDWYRLRCVACDAEIAAL